LEDFSVVRNLIEYGSDGRVCGLAAGAIMPGVATSLSQIFSKLRRFSVIGDARLLLLLPKEGRDYGLLSDGIKIRNEGDTLMKNLILN